MRSYQHGGSELTQWDRYHSKTVTHAFHFDSQQWYDNRKFPPREGELSPRLRLCPRAFHSGGISPGSASSSDLRPRTYIIRALWALREQHTRVNSLITVGNKNTKLWQQHQQYQVPLKPTFHAPGTPGGVLMNLPLKCWIMASHFSVDSILKRSMRLGFRTFYF